MNMDTEKIFDALGKIDDAYLDEAVDYKPARRIKHIKGAVVLAAAVAGIVAVSAAAIATVPDLTFLRPENNPSGAEEYMEHFGEFYEEDSDGLSVVATEGSVTLEVTYPEEGGVIIKAVADESAVPFDTHPHIILNGIEVDKMAGEADPFVFSDNFDPDSFIGYSALSDPGDGQMPVRMETLNGNELHIFRVTPESNQRYNDAWDEMRQYYITHPDDIDYDYVNELQNKIDEALAELEPAKSESPEKKTVKILSIVAYNDDLELIRVIGDWETEVEY